MVKANLTQIAASKAPLALLQGAGKLAEQFDVVPTDQEASGQGGLPLITLVPKPEEKDRSAGANAEGSGNASRGAEIRVETPSWLQPATKVNLTSDNTLRDRGSGPQPSLGYA